MKKILLLLIIPLFIGGCYDYHELNELALATAVGIDYEDDSYEVTIEILSTKKEGESSGSSKSYLVSAKSKTISEAFDNISKKLDKNAYFEHIEVVIISEDVAKSHMDDISDYLVRTTKLRNEFYTVIASNCTSKELLETKSEEFPIVSSFLVDNLENNKFYKNASYYETFTKTLNNILTNGKDTKLSVFTKKNDKIELIGLGLFEDYKLKTILNTNEATIFNLLSNNVNDINFSKTCSDNKEMVISIYNSKIDFNITNNELKVSGKMNALIKEDNCHYNLKEEKTYETLQKEFKKVIIKKLDKTMDKIKSAHSNALNIGKIYYNKTRDPNYFKWLNFKVTYDIDLKINKKGLTFELEGKK